MRKKWKSRTGENLSLTITAFFRVCINVFAQLQSIKGVCFLPTKNLALVQGSVGASFCLSHLP